MRIYGTDINTDNRYLTVFARDIAVFSKKDSIKLASPSFIANFPFDLANRNLEYIGIYEDGWISELAFLVLASKFDTNHLLIRGGIPQINDFDFKTNLIINN